MTGEPKTFVLVPGAWMGAWAWEDVARELRERGHRAEPLTLTGLDGDGGAAGTGLATHVDDVVALLEREDLREVVLVGHSYSGLVVGQAADRAPDRVARTVFVEAFLPRDGRSMLDAFPPGRREAELRGIAGNGGLWPRPTVAELQDGNGLSDEQVRRLAERLVDHPGRTLTEPAALSRPLREQRGTYIAADPDAGGEAEFAALRDDPRWAFRTLDAGHWPMVSAAGELVDLLVEAAADERRERA